MQAIVLATKNGAEHLGIADRKGLVKEGMEADLILLDKNPAENIANISLIDKVFRKGNIAYSQKVIQSFEIPDFNYPEGLISAEYVSADGKDSRALSYERLADENVITQTTSHGGEKWAEETFTVDRNLSATKWTYLRPSDNTDITAVRENGTITLNGSFKGKPQDKSLSINEGLWYQMMDLCLPAFSASELDEILFYSIGTGNNMGAMSPGEFGVKKIGTEDVTIDGKTYFCKKLSMVLTMFSWAWTGIYWIDTETGLLVQSGEKKGKNEKIMWQLKKLSFK